VEKLVHKAGQRLGEKPIEGCGEQGSHHKTEWRKTCRIFYIRNFNSRIIIIRLAL